MRSAILKTGAWGTAIVVGSFVGCASGSQADSGSTGDDGSISIYPSGSDGCTPSGEFAMDCAGGGPGTGGGSNAEGGAAGESPNGGAGGIGGSREVSNSVGGSGGGTGGSHEEGTGGSSTGGSGGSTTDGTPPICPEERPDEQAECSGELECSYEVECGTLRFRCQAGHWVAGERPVCETPREPTPCGPQEDLPLLCKADQVCIADLKDDDVDYRCELNPCQPIGAPNTCDCVGSLCRGDDRCELRDAGAWFVCNADWRG